MSLTRRDLAAMLPDPTKDKRYLETGLGGAVADYLAWYENERGAAERSVDDVERALARMALLLHPKTEHDVTTDDLRLARDAFPRGSRSKITSHFRGFWAWLYEEERTDRDPMARVRSSRRQTRKIQAIFSEAEVAKLISAQTLIRDRVGVLLLLRVGLRKYELRHLRVGDVDLREKWVIVQRGKGSKGRVVPIGGSVIQALEEYMLTPIERVKALEGQTVRWIGRPPETSDYVLYPTGANRYGPSWADPARPMGDGAFQRWWQACVERAGVRYRKAHMARHTYATEMVRQSHGDLASVQKALGHASVRTTIDEYAHLVVDDVAILVDRFDPREKVPEKK